MTQLSPSLSTAATQFIDYAAHRKLSPSTQAGIRQMLSLLFLAIDDLTVDQIELKHIAAFWDVYRVWPRNAAKLRARDLLNDAALMQIGWNQPPKPDSFSSVRRTAAILSSFFRWLHAHRLITHDKFPVGAIEAVYVGSVRQPFRKCRLRSRLPRNPTSGLSWICAQKNRPKAMLLSAAIEVF